MFRTARAAVNLVSLGFLLGGVLFGATPASAGVLDASWTAPTTNTDGSSLTDLASYRVYYGTSSSPCPGASFFQVASSTPSPSPNQTITVRLTGLATGTLYYVSVTAVVTRGAESACTTSANAVARLDFAVNPTGTMNFGSVNLGSSADQTFTVSNLEPATGGGTVSGTASAPAPFSIVSGSPFTLGVGASQAVTVRFSPTMSATATVNLTFAADRDTTSRIVTGDVLHGELAPDARGDGGGPRRGDSGDVGEQSGWQRDGEWDDELGGQRDRSSARDERADGHGTGRRGQHGDGKLDGHLEQHRAADGRDYRADRGGNGGGHGHRVSQRLSQRGGSPV